MFNERDDNVAFLHRALVIAVDLDGGKLENPTGAGETSNVIDGKTITVKATVGPVNPPNSVKARVMTDGFDQFTGDAGLRVFWPFFPEHISLPIKPGEHTYVIFEGTGYEHGLWVTKVPGHDNVNIFMGSDAYKPQDPSLSEKFDDTRAAAPPAEITNEKAAAEIEGNDGRLTAAFFG